MSRFMRRQDAAFFHIPGVLAVVVLALLVRRGIAAAAAAAGVVDSPPEFQAEIPATEQPRIAASASDSSDNGASSAAAAAAAVLGGDAALRRPLMRASPPQPSALAQVADGSSEATSAGMSVAMEAEIISMLHKQQAELDMLTEELRQRKQVEAWKAEHSLSRTRRHVPIAEQLARDLKSPSSIATLALPTEPVRDEKMNMNKTLPQADQNHDQLNEEEKAVATSSEFDDEELKILQEAGVNVIQPKTVAAATSPKDVVAAKPAGMQKVKAWVESHSQHHPTSASSKIVAAAVKGVQHQRASGGLLDDKQQATARADLVGADDPVSAADAAMAPAQAAVAQGAPQIGGVPLRDPAADVNEKGPPPVSYQTNVVTKIGMGFGIFAALMLIGPLALVYHHHHHHGKKAEALRPVNEGEDEDKAAKSDSQETADVGTADKYYQMKEDMKVLKEEHEKLKEEHARAKVVTELKAEREAETNAASKVIYGDSILLRERDSPEERLRRHYCEMFGLACILVFFCGIVVFLVNAIAEPSGKTVVAQPPQAYDAR